MANERRLIDGSELLRYVERMERLALDRIRDTPTNSPAYGRYATQYSERAEIRSVIENAPPVDAVEVCRCKDCVFYRETQDWNGDAYKACHLRADVIIQKRNQDDFCSYGEKREVE